MAQASENAAILPVGSWSPECQEALNKQINLEFTASYMYTAVGHFFNRQDVSLRNIGKFFLENAKEELEHANKFIAYQNRRGGTTTYSSIEPVKFEMKPGSFSALDGMKKALDLEKAVNVSLLNLCQTAENANDPEFTDFIEANYLHEQVEAIFELEGYITNLTRVGTGLGEYIFDKEFRD